MHEFSVANHLLELSLKNAAENSSRYISKISIKIGKLSGVEPHFLRSAFDILKEKTIAEKAELEIIHQDIVIFCNNCGKEFTLTENDFCCPECKGKDIRVTDGEDMMLMSMELL